MFLFPLAQFKFANEYLNISSAVSIFVFLLTFRERFFLLLNNKKLLFLSIRLTGFAARLVGKVCDSLLFFLLTQVQY